MVAVTRRLLFSRQKRDRTEAVRHGRPACGTLPVAGYGLGSHSGSHRSTRPHAPRPRASSWKIACRQLRPATRPKDQPQLRLAWSRVTRLKPMTSRNWRAHNRRRLGYPDLSHARPRHPRKRRGARRAAYDECPDLAARLKEYRAPRRVCTPPTLLRRSPAWVRGMECRYSWVVRAGRRSRSTSRMSRPSATVGGSKITAKCRAPASSISCETGSPTDVL